MEKPELVLKELDLGRKFSPFIFKITKEMVDEFMEITGDHNPLYYDTETARKAGFEEPVAPPGLATIFGRQAYLKDFTMPSGGVLAKQEIEFLCPVPVNTTLEVFPEVVERYEKDGKQYVCIRSVAKDPDGREVTVVNLTGIWPK